MARTPEGAVKDAVKKLLDKHGVYHFFPAMNGMGRAGIPDIVACMRGHFVGIECKAGKGQTTALQRRELSRIEQAGGIALVINETTLQSLAALLEGEQDDTD